MKPWVRGPFELLRHAEGHRLAGDDFDRRMALISFDNAVEAAVVAYLSLNPSQRGGREFQKDKVAHWHNSFLTKLEFLETFAGLTGQPMAVQRDEMTYIHKLRNDLYHAGSNLAPSVNDILTAREGAIWTISALFSIDARAHLEAKDVDEATPAPQVSADTELLEQLIELRKRVDSLSESLERPGEAAGSMAERIAQLDPEGVLNAASFRRDLAEAEEIKDRILNGQPLEQGDDRLRELTARIGPLTEHIGSRLAAHQRSTAEQAYRATVPLSETGGVAGLVHQSLGTGMLMSTLAYLALCKDSVELQGHAQLVLFDRRDALMQFQSRVLEEFKELTHLSISAPASTQELAVVLAMQANAIVLATTAQVRALAGTKFSSKQIVVCSQISLRDALLALLKNLFPNGIFIAFAGTMPRMGDSASEQWGPVIATYKWLDAIQDGWIAPPAVIERADVISTPEAGGNPLAEIVMLDEQANAIAKAVAEDFLCRSRSTEDARSVVLVPSLVWGARLSQQLTPLLPGVEVVHFAPSRDGVRAGVVVHHYVHGARPTILVTTLAALSGLDLRRGGALYVTCRVPESSRELVLSKAARIRSAPSAPGVVVDFASNAWHLP